MSSRRGTFVFVQLPGETEPVVAGRYEVETTRAGGVGHFVYGMSYLARHNAVALDPIHLPLSDEEFTTTRIAGMFGAFRDSAPDVWGRLVLERRQARRDWTELDYLLAAPDQRVGALSYGPTNVAPAPPGGRAHTLSELGRVEEAAGVVEAEASGQAPPLTHDLADLLEPSSGLGGARPKTTVVDDAGSLWVAKFPSRGDRRVNAVTEAAYLSMAGACGIRVPAHRVIVVGERPTLLVRRFDRQPGPGGPTRSLFLSAHTLLGLDESVVDRARWSYLELAHVLRRISDEAEADARELFARMAFNALVTNLDDHPRNHAVIGTLERGWRLSPAYDLVASNASSVEERSLAMTCGVIPGRERWANRANLVSGAAHFGLSEEAAQETITRIRDTVTRTWRSYVEAHGGTEQDCRNLEFAIAYPGFEQEP